MLDPEVRERADQRFQRALDETGARDPRDFYRERLRAIRDLNRDAFDRARGYFETRLIPAVAEDDSDPVAEWMDYGRVLAELTQQGATVRIDPSGRSHPYARPVPLEDLVLHLPVSVREPALPVALPPELSPAQRATFDLLVKGAKRRS